MGTLLGWFYKTWIAGQGVDKMYHISLICPKVLSIAHCCNQGGPCHRKCTVSWANQPRKTHPVERADDTFAQAISLFSKFHQEIQEINYYLKFHGYLSHCWELRWLGIRVNPIEVLKPKDNLILILWLWHFAVIIQFITCLVLIFYVNRDLHSTALLLNIVVTLTWLWVTCWKISRLKPKFILLFSAIGWYYNPSMCQALHTF